MRIPSLVPVLVVASSFACGKKAAEAPPAPPMTAVVSPEDKAREALAAEVRAVMDEEANPCVDFYQYACGGWVGATTLPADKSRMTRSFTTIADQNEAMLREILDDAAKNPGEDASRKKIGAFYQACMDEEAAQARGLAPVQPTLDLIAAAKDNRALWALAGKLFAEGHGPFFAMGVEPDYKNPEINLVGVSQGGLSMPDRSFYLEKENEALKAEFEASAARILTLSGVEAGAAARLAKDVVAFETRLATIAWPRADLRDAEKTYHPKNLKELSALTPGLDWKAFFGAAGYPDLDKFNVGTPSFFEGLAKVMKESKPDVVKAYLRHHVLVNNAALLTREIDEAHFEFYGKKLTGQKAQRERWKRCVGAVEDALGEELGKVYVQRAFAGDSKQVALDMIQRVERAFEASLPELSWMDEPTRKVAVVKAQAITNKIGYPDKWRDYSGLSVSPTDHYGNVVRGRAALTKFWMDQAGKQVDKTIWYMNPQEVNAYYNPLANEIAFPAGILQPPFFSRTYPRAMNYGAMGMVMGHEISHGFDDSGRKFDANGRLVEWWAPEVASRFEERAACVEKQYAGYEVAPDLFVDGKLTLGENIADIGGLKQAYAAYKKWESEQPAPEPKIAGLTPDQLYFVAYAQAWCTVASPEWEKVQVKSDPHSPARFRVNGPVRNLPEFARAFQCEQGQPLYPKTEDVCIVW